MNVCSSTVPDPSTSRAHHCPSALAAMDAMCFWMTWKGGNDLHPAENIAKMASGRSSPGMDLHKVDPAITDPGRRRR